MTEDGLADRLASLGQVLGRRLPEAFKAGYRVDESGALENEHGCLSLDDIETEWNRLCALLSDADPPDALEAEGPIRACDWSPGASGDARSLARGGLGPGLLWGADPRR